MIPSIRTLQVRNYRSIAEAWVSLEPFTALVGPNGSGKSNTIDALAFVQESLSESVEGAFRTRGGISAVRHGGRSAGKPGRVKISLNLDLGEDVSADYAFEIVVTPPEEGFSVARETCVVAKTMGFRHAFEVRYGKFVKEVPGIRPKLAPNRLALFAASDTDEFRPVYDFLSSMRFYSIMSAQVRELQQPDSGAFLKRDGSNAAAVLKRLQDEPGNGQRYERLCRLLARVVAGVQKVRYRSVGHKETLQFEQDVGFKRPRSFDALNMSDGTLRVLGLLLAVYQSGSPRLVAIEEPEGTVHPAVTELMVQVLMDAASERQILIATHSPDMLDYKELKDTHIRVVTMERGQTLISPVSESSRQAIRESLYTPGELLRSGELTPDVTAAKRNASQLSFWPSSSSRRA